MHAHNICAAIVGHIALQHTVHVHSVWPCLQSQFFLTLSYHTQATDQQYSLIIPYLINDMSHYITFVSQYLDLSRRT